MVMSKAGMKVFVATDPAGGIYDGTGSFYAIHVSSTLCAVQLTQSARKSCEKLLGDGWSIQPYELIKEQK